MTSNMYESTNMQFNLNNYPALARATAIYPGQGGMIVGEQSDVRGVFYTAMAMAGEAGEVAGKVSKVLRDKDSVFDEAALDGLAMECGDVLWSLTMLIEELGYHLPTIAAMNIDKLRDRAARGKLKGSGDAR